MGCAMWDETGRVETVSIARLGSSVLCCIMLLCVCVRRCCRSLGEEAFGGLQGVLGDADERPTIPQRVFNWWYPARRQ